MNVIQKENESGNYHFQSSFYCHVIEQKARSLQNRTLHSPDPALTAEPACLPQYQITSSSPALHCALSVGGTPLPTPRSDGCLLFISPETLSSVLPQDFPRWLATACIGCYSPSESNLKAQTPSSSLLSFKRLTPAWYNRKNKYGMNE